LLHGSGNSPYCASCALRLPCTCTIPHFLFCQFAQCPNLKCPAFAACHDRSLRQYSSDSEFRIAFPVPFASWRLWRHKVSSSSHEATLCVRSSQTPDFFGVAGKMEMRSVYGRNPTNSNSEQSHLTRSYEPLQTRARAHFNCCKRSRNRSLDLVE